MSRASHKKILVREANVPKVVRNPLVRKKKKTRGNPRNSA